WPWTGTGPNSRRPLHRPGNDRGFGNRNHLQLATCGNSPENRDFAFSVICPQRSGPATRHLRRKRGQPADASAGTAGETAHPRGIVFSGGSLATVLSAQSASASAPPALVASTIKAASLCAAGKAAATGVISAQVAALTEGMVQTMFATNFKSV